MMQSAEQRTAYSESLVSLGKSNKRIVVLDADVSKSTRTSSFGELLPDQFFNFGIAEQNMMSAAAGMASCGLVPFVNSFSFLTTYRAGEQFRTSIVYPSLNVKVIAHYGGLSDSFDGPTHQTIADIAWVRALPNLCVIVPTDAVEVAKMLPIIAEHNGPVWVRLSRNPSQIVHDSNYEFKLGKATILQEGNDISLISCGTVIDRVLQAATRLKGLGISARVMTMPTVKPIDEAAILKTAQMTNAIITCEEHSVIGGLGAAVCEVVAKAYPVPVERIGIPDTFGESGNYEELLNRYGLSVDNIVNKAQSLVKQKTATA